MSGRPIRTRAKRWCFTLNNYIGNHVAHLRTLGIEQQQVEYIVWGREVAPTTLTPHLQGFVIFRDRLYLAQAKRALFEGFADAQRTVHVEVARGTAQQNKNYCSKEDEGFEEYGECPTAGQGRRTDLERFFEWADEFIVNNGRPPTTPEAAADFPSVVVKHSRLMEVVRLRTPRALFHEDAEPRGWQERLRQQLEAPAEDRKIKFVVDPDGGVGKSWFVRWFLDLHPHSAQIFRPGKVTDLAHAVKVHCNVFLFDVPRNGMQFLQIQVLEMLKDRVIFSPKYNSTTKFLQSVPHVVVFSNEHPADVGITLTNDRYEFVSLD